MLAERLRAEMERQNLRQSALAKKSGVLAVQINGVLNGKVKSFSADNMVAMAGALGVSVEWLATGKQRPAEATLSVREASLIENYRRLSALDQEHAQAVLDALAEKVSDKSDE